MAARLSITAFCNAALVVLLCGMERHTAFFKKVSGRTKQIICGVAFGCLAMYSSTPAGGIDIGGAMINVRDASPLCAGLIFGAPAGIIAGIMGGVFRYLAPFWGLAGTYTQLACSVSTVLSGFLAALLRRYMFDDKRPAWIYGIAMICEVLHMLMIFFTNMDDVLTAFTFVDKCTLPMVLGNGIAVGIAVALVSFTGRKKQKLLRSQIQISQAFQFWLLVCIIIAFGATSLFISVLQTRMSETEAERVITINLRDVHQDITDASDQNLLEKTMAVRRGYLAGESVDSLAETYDVIEVNIIDTNGIIIDTNNKEYKGYHMAEGEQSAEFLVLLEGTTDQYVQDYRPTSYDGKTYRKYGALTLPEGGFLQIGYDASQFSKDIDAFVGKIAKNRHIGNQGSILICDGQFCIVTEGDEHFGESLDTLGIHIDTEDIAEGQIFKADLKGRPHLCAYRFAEGYHILGAMPLEEAMLMKTVSVYMNVFMELAIFAALFVLIYFLIKRIIIDNLRKINASLAKITEGDLDVRVDVRANEEFASLSDDINSTVTTLKRYIAEAAARIDKELLFAQQIQYSCLPSVFPDRCECQLYASMTTAKEVGGDFYDLYMLSENVIAFVIADVSGKGIPAAMFMMRAKTIIKDLAESGREPDEIFTMANEKLCEDNDAGMFVTAWLGILDFTTGILRFANAGHNPPLICRSGSRPGYLKARSGLVLAGMKGIRYRKNELRLAPGDRIYLYTDGVTEATDPENRLYGEQRLLELVDRLEMASPQDLCRLVKEDIDRFAKGAPQFDDITMLSLSFRCILSDRRLSVVPDGGSRKAVEIFVQRLTQKLELLPKISSRIHIIFDEIYTNILHYSKASNVEISYKIEEGKLFLSFSDNGIPYDPLEAPDPDITLSAKEREIGGLGIFMVKKMSEKMEYVYEEDRNILKIVIGLAP